MKKILLFLVLLMPLMASATIHSYGCRGNITLYGNGTETLYHPFPDKVFVGLGSWTIERTSGTHTSYDQVVIPEMEIESSNAYLCKIKGNNLASDGVVIKLYCRGTDGNDEKYECYWNITVKLKEVTKTSINSTNFPDANFRNYLSSQSYGTDGVLTDAEIASVTDIIVPENNNIQSLKGIEFFTALTALYCVENKLTSLDVSKNTALTYLACDGNLLTSLDVSKNTALRQLYCYNNQLSSLDVSKNTALTDLSCFNNKLTSLDVSKNTALTYLLCYSNQIYGTEMDALVASLPTVSSGRMNVIYNENEGNVMTTTQVATAKAKGWTPQYTTLNGVYWQEYAGSEPVPVEKCATPTISFVNGKLEFSCETEGVEFVSNITSSDSGDYEGNSIPLTSTYIVSVYAKKAGYADSDVATEEITAGGTTGIRGDVNGDNEVGMPDVMYIVNYILNGRFPDENLQSPRVRFGIFETVAGYSVAINSINVDYNLTIGTDAIGSALNTTASNPTWDTANGEYSAVQPNEAYTNPMLIKLDYTLTSEDGSGENIVVRNAEVEVPAEVLKWQSNKDYTYILKIGDNPDWKPTMKLAELFPITLWGVEIKENSNNVTR